MSQSTSHLTYFDTELFGTWIRQFRAQHRLSQATLAGMLGISRSRLSRIELGKIAPDLIILFVLLSAMDRNNQVGQLFWYTDDLLDFVSRFNEGFVGTLESVR